MRTSLLSLLLAFLLPAWGFSQCTPDFLDGFESGSYSPTWTIGSGLTSGAVTTTNPSAGMYRLEGTGGTSTHLTGFSTTITPVTPNYISWDVYPTGSGASNYLVAGDASVTASNCIMFCYWQGGTNLRFVSSSTAVYNCSANAWYHIEMRNINWTLHTFDIYINNALVQASFPFRSSSINNISNIHLYNFNTEVGVWDNIQIGAANAPNTSSVVTGAACHGDANGMVDLSVTGGTPNYSYLWSNGATTQDLSGLVAGSYTVTVTDNATCTKTTTVTITEPSTLDLTQSVSSLSCNGSSDGAIDNTATGGTPTYHYAWSTGDTVADLSGLAAATYMVTLTDAHNCTSIDSIVVSEPLAIVVADSVITPSCIGDTNGFITAYPSGGAGGYSYHWNNGSLNNSIGPVAAGNYSVLVTDNTGCTVLSSLVLPDPAALVLNATPNNPLCTGDNSGQVNLTPTGGTPGYGYIWSNGATTQNISGLGAGTYSVTLADAHGCLVSDTVVLNEPAVITATGVVTDAMGANNGSIDLTAGGGTGNLSYLWSNGATTQDLTGLAAGNYTVTITDVNGCTEVQSFTVSFLNATSAVFPVGVAVSPNPFATGFTVSLSGLGSEAAQLSLIDLQGRVLWMEADVLQTNTTVTPTVAAGVYFLRVQIGAQSKTLRLMHQ